MSCWHQIPDYRPTADEIFTMLSCGTDAVLGDADDDKTRYYLDDIDEDAIKKYLDLVREDERIANEGETSQKVDAKQSHVKSLQQENQKLKTKKGQSNIPKRTPQVKRPVNQITSEVRIKKLENEVEMMKDERTKIFNRFDNMERAMKKRFKAIDSRFKILMSCMTSVVIPEDMTMIPYAAFMDCKCLESVTFSQSVTVIGNLAFYGCSALKEANIPASVTLIDK